MTKLLNSGNSKTIKGEKLGWIRRLVSTLLDVVQWVTFKAHELQRRKNSLLIELLLLGN
jgi:hypothetical protein